MKSVKIISYNTLSQGLVDRYINKKYIDENYRFRVIKNQLLDFINDDNIICLQELGLEWYSKLSRTFDKHNYKMIYNSYSNKKSDFMGVCICVPNKYKIEDVKIYELKRSFEDKRRIYQNNNKIKDSDFLRYKNTMITLKLKLNENIFFVSTVHIPNSHKDMEIMSYYYYSALSYVKLLNKENFPTIICGDFNLVPDDFSKLLKKKELTFFDDRVYNLLNEEDIKIYDAYSLNIFKFRLRTTNIPDDGGNFDNILDYILINEKFDVLDTLPVEMHPKKAPNNHQGSDHLPIGATLVFN